MSSSFLHYITTKLYEEEEYYFFSNTL